MDTIIETTQSISEYYLEGEYGRMRYWRSTPQQGVPIVLIHGYGALIEHWRRVMPRIAQEHTVYALDLYGFGYSTRPRVPPTCQMWSRQVATLLEHVQSDAAVIVGHSMGGIVATQFARDYPQLTRGLVLVNSAGLQPTQEPSAFGRAFFRLVQSNGVGEILAGIFANSWGVRQGLLSAYHRKEMVTPELIEIFSAPLREPNSIQSYLATMRALMNLSLDIKPGDLPGPTLLLWGAKDRSIPPAVAQFFKQQLVPHADIHVITDSGHCPFDEAAEDFCTALLPWVNRLMLGNTPLLAQTV